MTFPANFMLVAAMNSCPCGSYGDSMKHCTCSAAAVTRYRQRIPGPLLDRIDIFVDVPRVAYEKLTEPPSATGSEDVRLRVENARVVQRARFRDAGIAANAELGAVDVGNDCPAEVAARPLRSLG